jgi:hypothetical protein
LKAAYSDLFSTMKVIVARFMSGKCIEFGSLAAAEQSDGEFPGMRLIGFTSDG